MIEPIEKIKDIIEYELLGHECYIRNDNNEMVTCKITRIDLFVSNNGTGINAHVQPLKKGTINYPLCVTLEGYDYNISHKNIGFLSAMDYSKFYKEIG